MLAPPVLSPKTPSLHPRPARRLSTAAQCDNIVVLDNGRVAEQGSHAELLARGGRYADLWARQASSMDEVHDTAAAVGELGGGGNGGGEGGSEGGSRVQGLDAEKVAAQAA